MLLATSEVIPAKICSDDWETYELWPISGLPCVIMGDLDALLGKLLFVVFGLIGYCGIGIALAFLYFRPWYSPGLSALFIGIVISHVLGLCGKVSFILRVGETMISLSSFDSGSPHIIVLFLLALSPSSLISFLKSDPRC